MSKQTQLSEAVKGRFAPSPSGRMHLGNIYTALLSWLSAKSKGGTWLLRIEDLDPQRSKKEFAELIEDDLHWLGLIPDEGGLSGTVSAGPYSQSLRGEIYNSYYRQLLASGLCYGCRCRRADIMATQAPHQSDGRIVYAGTCRPQETPPFATEIPDGLATRLYAKSEDIFFNDGICGPQCVNPAEFCGDFIIRRADGAWAYQLAVVVDDALMGVTEVVRGDDLLLSTAQQIYLQHLLGFPTPEYYHLPLVRNSAGIRLSKRDSAMSMEYLREHHTPEEVIGMAAARAGLVADGRALSAGDLLAEMENKSASKLVLNV
ncbi:MAG: tRNA glutamyl-Q(34) synthetase GluQRS [Muribaculaceae bacterium]|nr:tRNA glutamyl-Q(34) synthetase GluQRS [Muribaculaceae bacterium]